MAFVVTDNCAGCRFTDCVTVCPVECFHADDDMLYIDPNECIDCGACLAECPVDAIFDEAYLPVDKAIWKARNAERAGRLPLITQKREPLPGAAARREALRVPPMTTEPGERR